MKSRIPRICLERIDGIWKIARFPVKNLGLGSPPFVWNSAHAPTRDYILIKTT